MAHDSTGATTRIERQKTGSGARGRRGWLAMLAGAVFGLLVMAVVPEEAYALPVCGATIAACCKITSPGSYAVSGNFPATGSSGACIRIVAPNVVLNGNDYTITGPGSRTMKGIVIGAPEVTVDSITVTGFAVGIQSNAKKTHIDLTEAYSNGTGIVINGADSVVGRFGVDSNDYNGLIVAGAGSSVGLGGGSSNGGNGILVKSTAVGASIGELILNDNGRTGIKVDRSTGGFFDSLTTDGNGQYGIWLRGTKGVPLFDFEADGNAIAGVYLGCHAGGPSNAPCPPSVSPTLGTLISVMSATSTANGPGQQYGVVVDIRNHGNRIYNVTAGSNVMFDGYDGKTGCDANTWLSNSFSNPNQSCVQ